MSYNEASIREAELLIAQLYGLVEKLEALFPGRRFTLDGHLVGSIGEVLAAARYELDLLTMSFKGCDATSTASHRVEIKVTQKSSVAFRCEPPHLLVLQLSRDGSILEVYNGPGGLVWPHVGPQQSNGQRTIGLSKLRRLQAHVPLDQRLPRKETAPAQL